LFTDANYHALLSAEVKRMFPMIVAAIFVVSLVLIVVFKRHRTILAMLAALLMYFLLIMIKGISFYEFLNFIDFKTLGLILGILVTAEVISDSGLFQFIAIKTIRLAKGDSTLLAFIICFMGILLSSVLTAVVAVIIMVKLTLSICKALDVNPIPYLISVVISMDMGGLMSMIANTPNIIIAQEAGLSFAFFFFYVTPYALITFTVLLLLFKLYFKTFGSVDRIRKTVIEEFEEWSLVPSKTLFYAAIILLVGLVLGFILIPDPLFVSLFIATLSVIFMRMDPDIVFDKLDWGTVAFLISMFVLVGAVEEEGLLYPIGVYIAQISGGNPLLISLFIIVVLSWLNGFVDEVMLALTLIPIIKTVITTANLTNTAYLWTALIITTNLGGGLSPVSSPVMLFMLSQAGREGYKVNVGQIVKLGLIATATEILIAAVYLTLRIVLLI